MRFLPFLDRVEASFSIGESVKWMEKNWTATLYIAVLYVILVLTGRYWMKDKPAYSLRSALLAWNIGLAVFSTLGATTLLPSLIDTIRKDGMNSVCWTPASTNPQLCLWGFLYTISKLPELLDTAFIVLRKAPLLFLHVYHHVTVLVFGWYIYQRGLTGLLHWGGAVNYSVHSIMYSYYAARIYGIRVPRQLAQLITILQLTQFVVLFFSGIVAGYMTFTGVECNPVDVIILQIMLTFSYGLLFLNFYFKRYWKKSAKKE